MTALQTMPKRPGDRTQGAGHGGKRPGAGRKPQPEGARPAMTMVRSSAEWKAWVEELAEYNRTNVTDLIDQALVRHAREIGFAKVAPKR
jgi:hypothetical protein